MIIRSSNLYALSRGIVLLAMLASCSETSAVQSDDKKPNPIVITNIQRNDTAPVPDAAPVQEVSSSLPNGPHVVEGTFKGSGMVLHGKAHGKAAVVVDEANASSLNFVNADIHDVAKVVLGDVLGLNYTIAPAVQGNITLKVNQNLPKEALLPILNTAFRLNGAAIINSQGVVRIVPSTDAPHEGAVSFARGKNSDHGFGLQIVSLHNIGVDELQKVLTQVAPNGGVIPVESTRNILILAGTEDERSAMLDVVDSLDVDWLSGMSFGLYPLKEASAKALTKDLWDVLGSQNGPMSKMVRLVPLDRLNAILVISSESHYLKEIKTWIDRLDVDQAPSDRKLWVYQVQNGRAVDLAKTLQKLVPGQDTKVETSATSSAPALTPPPTPSDLAAKDQPSTNANNIELNMSGPPAQGVRIIADEPTNSIIVWATKAEFSLMQDALKKLDIVPMQVRIEAVIAEVTLTDDLRYGVQYLLQGKHGGAVLTNSSTLSVAPALPGFSAFVTGSNISSILDLLQSVTDVHVVSSPQLMVLNNQTATLQVGDQVPVATQSAVSTLTAGAPVVNSITMQDTGVILKVTPRVNASGMVLMDISQEVSDVTPTTTSQIDSPTIQERKVSSSVAVRDGETIALGGLIQDNTTNDKSGIPLLEDIPYAGNLFSYTTVSKSRTELLVLVTPRVVRNDMDVRNVTEEMRQEMSAVIPLNAKVHH